MDSFYTRYCSCQRCRFTGLSPASAVEEPTVADDIRAAAATQSIVRAETDETNNLEAVDVVGGLVSAPTGTDAGLEMRLPGAPLAPEEDHDLSLNVTGTADYTTALQAAGNGSFRALMHIESVSARQEYRFELSDGVELISLEDGGITVRYAEGQLLGTFEPAWAVDANGDAVPTSYRIENSALVQTVAFNSKTAFPVVADPFWIPALFAIARISAHAASQAAARGVSQALIKQVVQNGAKSAGNKGTSIFTQGSGANRIRVIVDNKTGNVITVTKG